MSYAPHAHSVDWLFAQPGERSRSTGLSEVFATGQALTREDSGGPPPVVWPQAPPRIEDDSDLQAAYEWLQNEKLRLEQYTRSQFEMIEEQHQTMLAKHFSSEQTLALRSQELNREMQFLAAQTETLQRRSRELSEREVALAGQMERLAQAQEELGHLQETSATVRQDTEAQRALLDSLRAETAQLQRVDAAAQARFNAFESELRERQASWEKKQAEITARQAQMEERYQALERAEDAARRRLAELDDLENQIRCELEQQEGQLVKDRREIELLRAHLHSRAALPA